MYRIVNKAINLTRVILLIITIICFLFPIINVYIYGYGNYGSTICKFEYSKFSINMFNIIYTKYTEEDFFSIGASGFSIFTTIMCIIIIPIYLIVSIVIFCKNKYEIDSASKIAFTSILSLILITLSISLMLLKGIASPISYQKAIIQDQYSSVGFGAIFIAVILIIIAIINIMQLLIPYVPNDTNNNIIIDDTSKKLEQLKTLNELKETLTEEEYNKIKSKILK